MGVEIFLPRKFSLLFPMKINPLYSLRVGVEKLSCNVKWAAEFFIRKCCFPPLPPVPKTFVIAHTKRRPKGKSFGMMLTRYFFWYTKTKKTFCRMAQLTVIWVKDYSA